MLQITEDTPPDMLAGAMDLTVHLPTGRNVKMSVERSTPMMDLLVQITTAHQLQLSNYTLQALWMAPSSDHRDRILPYKPNTPIGTLDTQHIKVIPKTRTIPVPKNIAPGHQPFESTFRLKVHLPRNQLYVARVSRNVLLEDIMKRVCEEKNLDPLKYEFKHPGNLDETLDPKLTLSDYQITEIYVVAKGISSLTQAFSTSDIMALRKEEERKQMHNKTGGGVFNLIFRRGKTSMGSGSVSSDTRSISPTHSDDSRSVTPPGVVQQPILPPPKQDPPPERPKPPQRKRRPAPKPPQPSQIEVKPTDGDEIDQPSEESRRNSDEKPPSSVSNVSEVSELQNRKTDGGLVISHSRNSSDSSGYHEASVLSENCNTSLPRRPKSAFVSSGDVERLSKMHSQSNSNLSKMASHSKSTTSLGMTGRKKKSAPPPPPTIRASNPQINIESASPVVASQSTSKSATVTPSTPLDTLVAQPKPLPRSKPRVPVPRPRIEIVTTTNRIETIPENTTIIETLPESTNHHILPAVVDNESVVKEIIEEVCKDTKEIINDTNNIIDNNNNDIHIVQEDKPKSAYTKVLELQRQSHQLIFSSAEFKNKIEQAKIKVESPTTETVPEKNNHLVLSINNKEATDKETSKESSSIKEETVVNESKESPLGKEEYIVKISEESITKKSNESSPIEEELTRANNDPVTESTTNKEIDTTTVDKKHPEVVKESDKTITIDKKLPEVVGVIPKTPKDKKNSSSKYDSFGKRRFQNSSIIGSFEDDSLSTKSRTSSVASALANFSFVDEFSDLDDKVFSGSISSQKNFSLKDEVLNELYGIHNLEDIQLEKNQSISSLRSLRSLQGFTGGGMKKWHNLEDLDDISVVSQDLSRRWVVGDSEPESLTSHQALDSFTSSSIENKDESKPFGSTDSGIAAEATIEKLSEPEDCRPITPPPPPLFLDELIEPKLVEEKEPVIPEKEKSLNGIEEILKEETNEEERLKETSVTDSNEIDWQYQLPSPPKAFRDLSPVRGEKTSSDSISATDFKDSVVTSPELFEKLKSLEDTQSITTITDTQSITTFIADEPPLNTLTLENLEKRKSLVYNRELSTSFKMAEDPYMHSLNKFETTFVEVQKSSQKEPKYIQKAPSISNTLPNFKISTYDKPKEKIKVFEDDTIRSNENGISRIKKTHVESSFSTNRLYSNNLNRSYVASSMENISIRRNSNETPLKEREYTFYRTKSKEHSPISSVNRSESFNNENNWSPVKPVSRSRSHITLNGTTKYKTETQNKGEGPMERSNSLYDVSGLQSLGVMRLIQNKLNTPTSSLENLHINQEKYERPKLIPNPPKENPPIITQPEPVQNTEKVYKYQGPPSINMGTWSERPKVPVSVKEDEDYTLGNNISSKLIVNTTNNNITSNNSIEIRNSDRDKDQQEPSISIKVNGTDVPTTTSGNVVIKIGSNTSSQPKIIDNQRFISHTTASGYRKPFNDMNKNQRPHSIAFGSDFDISRVPVVRSVELKKPYKDFGSNNTSVTQIYQTEPETKQNGYLHSRFGTLKPTTAPVVRGFRTLPKDKDVYTTNSQVPFSQGTLRRTESSKLYESKIPEPEESKIIIENELESPQEDNKIDVNPPPPPMMPKVTLKKPVIRQIEPVLDPRDELLSAIRNFGGKKGLKSVKV